jgi:NTP pyrophosphatase (non-canonical NTP hydrolase)
LEHPAVAAEAEPIGWKSAQRVTFERDIAEEWMRDKHCAVMPLYAAPPSSAARATLTFDAFRAANVARCAKWHPAGIKSWSPSDWLTAVTGELGELASLLKMRNRERDGLPGNKFSPTQKQIADELADVVTYLDLLAHVLGVDLGRAAAEKFNEVSERVGFSDRIELAEQPSGAGEAGFFGAALAKIENAAPSPPKPVGATKCDYCDGSGFLNVLDEDGEMVIDLCDAPAHDREDDASSTPQETQAAGVTEAMVEAAELARTAGPKLAYYQTHEPPHCPTCDCDVPDEQGQK